MIEGKKKKVIKKKEKYKKKRERETKCVVKKRKKITISNNIDIFDKMPNYIRTTTFSMYTSVNFVDEEQNIEC